MKVMDRMRMAANQLVGVKRCPHCGVASPYLPFTTHIQTQEPEGALHGRVWRAYTCSSCNMVVIASAQVYVNGDGRKTVDEIDIIYPNVKTIASEIPEEAAHYLTQAVNILHAPDASVMMCATAVDAMLKAKGLTSGSLYSRIDEAVSQHILTPEIGKWAHEVRLEANDVRHADASKAFKTADQAKQTVDFTFALGEVLFVFPSKVARGIEKAAATSS